MKAPSRQLLVMPVLPLTLSVLSALTACSGLPGTASTSTAAQVSGTIIYPPAAGTAFFQASVNGTARTIASASVTQTGEYSLTLPASPPLPTSGNASSLIQPLQALASEFSSMNCGRASGLDPLARTVTLSAGTYQIDGQVAATLAPAVNVLGASQSIAPHTVSQRTYTYTDRKLALQGTLNCTFTTLDGSTLTGPLTLSGAMNTGWNTLESRAVFTTAGVQVSVTASPALNSVDWRYLTKP